MQVDIKVIPHKEQRYNTVGDWWFNPDNDHLYIRVSRLNNSIYENLIALHEQIEALLCLNRGISEKKVTEFDMQFERMRIPGNLDEPGDDIRAPYKKEHFFATSIERLIAAEFNVEWKEYEKAINSL